MSTKKFVILGAGGFGREVYGWLSSLINESLIGEIAGFIDDNAEALDGYANFPPIICCLDEYVPDSDTLLVCAIANPDIKRDVVQKLLAIGADFFTLVHPLAVVGINVSIGKGVIICPYTILSTDLTIGCFVTINSMCTIGHDSSIGDYCTISGHCDVTGGVVLEDGVFVGSHSSILPNVVVGARAVVGAGSLVLRKVKPASTVFGVPAKRISG